MSQSSSSRERINEERRRVLTERVFGGPGERAAYWATFATEFWDRVFEGMWPGDRMKHGRPFGSLLLKGIDIVEEGDNLVVEVEMPDYPKNSIHLRLRDNFLHISASRESVLDKEEDITRVHVAARPSRFSRTVWLPAPVASDAKATAKYHDGVLRVTIPIRTDGTITID